MRFNLFDHPIAAMVSDYFCPAFAWTGHAPFAFLAIELLQPRVLVELGTHYGASYCAFCQAVAELKLRTRCHAVDNWTGDKHTGRYSGDILTFLRNHHDPRYASFSSLMQMTFDEAAPKFAAGSIDLLHIDGSHDYDAVNHDYLNWKDKLSDRGAILFHDTFEKAPGFGVHRLWAELSSQFPSFEFHHNHGLGILAVGKNIPDPFMEFLDEARQHPAEVRETFSTLGRANEANCQLLLTAYWVYQVQTEINSYRRQIGQPVDPDSENLELAMQKSETYLFNTLKQFGAIIQQLSEMQRTISAGINKSC